MSITATSIKTMSAIIEDVQSKGYTVISGRQIVDAYAFYSIKRDDLFDEIIDCYFSAYINNNGTVVYKPYDEKDYYKA
jgi:hypothetical protein